MSALEKTALELLTETPEILEKFQEFRAYWDSIRTQTEVPLKSEFRPEKIRKLLPFITIDEYESSERIVSRLRGSNIVSRFDEDFTGRNLVPLFHEASRPLIVETCRRVVETPCGVRTFWLAESRQGKQTGALGYYLPLRGADGEKFFIGTSLETELTNWNLESRKSVIAVDPEFDYFDIGFGTGISQLD